MHADSSMAGFTLEFTDWFLEVIALDGVEVQKQRSGQIQSAGILFPGQRMDFVVRSSSSSTNILQTHKASMKVALDTKFVHHYFSNDTTFTSLTMPLRAHV
jgi:hypothetical protein